MHRVVIWMIRVAMCMYISEKYRGIPILTHHIIKLFQASFVLYAVIPKHNTDNSHQSQVYERYCMHLVGDTQQITIVWTGP